MQSLLEVPSKTLLFFIVEKRYVSTYEKLDRILVTDWEQKFPLDSVQALTREISDHTPLLLDGGNHRIEAMPGILDLNWGG
jgi:hypothetical protein